MNILTRLLLVAALLCGLLGSNMEVREANLSVGDQHLGEQVQQNIGWLRQMAEEPQTATGSIVLSVPSPSRLASFRSIRLLPTHGGKPNNPTGRWAKGNTFNPLLSPTLLSYRCRCWQRMTAASPRLRYVIALRRLLC